MLSWNRIYGWRTRSASLFHQKKFIFDWFVGSWSDARAWMVASRQSRFFRGRADGFCLSKAMNSVLPVFRYQVIHNFFPSMGLRIFKTWREGTYERRNTQSSFRKDSVAIILRVKNSSDASISQWFHAVALFWRHGFFLLTYSFTTLFIERE